MRVNETKTEAERAGNWTTPFQLYSVKTIVKEYNGHENVTFHWFFTDERSPQRPYHDLICGYDPHDPHACYVEGAIDELFSFEEAAALKAYLDREHGDAGETSIEELQVPMGKNVVGWSACPAGGGADFYMLETEPGYNLDFRVRGHFDLTCSRWVGPSPYFWIEELSEAAEVLKNVVERERSTVADSWYGCPSLDAALQKLHRLMLEQPRRVEPSLDDLFPELRPQRE